VSAVARSKKRVWRVVIDIVLISVGALLNALAINIFLLPNDVVAGGVTGLAVIGELSLGLPFGIGLILLNLPLLALQWRLLGGAGAFLRTLVGVILLAVFTELLGPHLPEVTSDRLLTICYGGGLGGLGLALVFHGKGTTGGADIVARLFHRWWGWGFGRTFLAINACVYGLAGILYGPEPAMVALLLSFVMSRTLDAVLHGMTSTRAVLIVTGRPDEVCGGLVKVLSRGVTVLNGTGGFTGQERAVLYAVVPRAEIQRLKQIVLERDPRAFMTVLSPRESIGGYRLATEH